MTPIQTITLQRFHNYLSNDFLPKKKNKAKSPGPDTQEATLYIPEFRGSLNGFNQLVVLFV